MNSLSSSRTSWLGLSSVGLLCIWFVLWFKHNEPYPRTEAAMAWIAFCGAHVLAVIAFRRDRQCWIYFLPLGFVWLMAMAVMLRVFR